MQRELITSISTQSFWLTLQRGVRSYSSSWCHYYTSPQRETVCILFRNNKSLFNVDSLGKVEPGSVKKVVKEITLGDKERLERKNKRPPLSEILNLHDFEVLKHIVVHILGPLTFCMNLGHCKASHVRESLGVLLLWCRWRNHFAGKSYCVPSVCYHLLKRAKSHLSPI